MPTRLCSFSCSPPPFFPFTPVFERQIIFPFSCRAIRWIPHSNGLSCWKLKEDILIPMTYKDEFAKRGCMTCAFLSLPVRMNHCTFMFSTFFFFSLFCRPFFSHNIPEKSLHTLIFFCRIIKSWKSLHWHMRAPQPLDQVLSPPELRPTFPCTIFRGSHSRRVFMNPSAPWILFENLLKGYRSPRYEVLCPKASWAWRTCRENSRALSLKHYVAACTLSSGWPFCVFHSLAAQCKNCLSLV